MQCTPSLLRLFPEAELRALADAPFLRVVAFGGEVLRLSDLGIFFYLFFSPPLLQYLYLSLYRFMLTLYSTTGE